MTLQRDVTFNLQAGEVSQPVPSTIPQSVASLANLGVSLFREHKAEQAQAAAETRQNDLLRTGRELVDQYLLAKEQTGDDFKAAMNFRQEVNKIEGLSEMEKQSIFKQFKEATGRATGAAALQGVEREAAELQQSVQFFSDNKDRATMMFSMHPELHNLVTTGQATAEQKREYVVKGNRALQKAEMEEDLVAQAQETVKGNVTAAANHLLEADNLLLNRIDATSELLHMQMTITAQNPTPENIQALENMRSQMLGSLKSAEGMVESRWMSLSADVDAEGQKLLKDKMTLSKNRIVTTREFLEGLDDEQFKSTAKAVKFLRDKYQLNAFETAPLLKEMQAEFGQSFNAALEALIVKDNSVVERLVSLSGTAVEQALTTKEQALQKLDRYLRLTTNKSLLDLSLDEREKAMGELFAGVKTEFDRGLLADRSANARQNIGQNLVVLFDEVVTIGDQDDRKQALSFINTEGFDKYIESLDEDTKKNLKGQLLQLNQDALQDNRNGLIQKFSSRKGVIYDAEKGKFKVDESVFLEDVPERLQRLGGVDAPKQRLAAGVQDARNNVAAANSYLDKVVAMKSESSFLAGLSDRDVRDWIIHSSEHKPKVEGEIRNFTEEFFEAAKQQVSVEELGKQKEQEAAKKTAMEDLQLKVDTLQKELAMATQKRAEGKLSLDEAIASAESEEEAVEIARQFFKRK